MGPLGLADVSDIFFFCLGEGKGECEAPGGGGAIFYGKSQEGGGAPGWVGAGARGREVVCGEFGNLGVPPLPS